MGKRSIIKDSSTIREQLKKRLTDLGLSNVQVAIEAERFNQSNVKNETLSRYFNGNSNNSLTEESIIYLCCRYGIPIKLVVGRQKIQDKKIVHDLPKYNEQECIKNLKEIYGIQEVKNGKAKL